MKKAVLTSFIICCLITAHAQDLNGKFFAGGSLGFEVTSANSNPNGITYDNSNAYQSYSFSPSVGYYLSNEVAIGLQLGYISTTTNTLDFNINNGSIQTQNYKTTSTTLSVAPLLRFTLPVAEKLEKLGFNINITLPYSYTKYNYSFQNSALANLTTGYIELPANYTANSYGLNIGPGFQWFVKDNIAVLGSLGALSYTHYITKATGNDYLPSSTTNTNDLKFSLTTGLSLGLTFYFGGSKENMKN